MNCIFKVVEYDDLEPGVTYLYTLKSKKINDKDYNTRSVNEEDIKTAGEYVRTEHNGFRWSDTYTAKFFFQKDQVVQCIEPDDCLRLIFFTEYSKTVNCEIKSSEKP
jgi:hypothetical protein